jgi:hypothetical protein
MNAKLLSRNIGYSRSYLHGGLRMAKQLRINITLDDADFGSVLVRIKNPPYCYTVDGR